MVKRLNIVPFGRELLRTLDLDPVYVMLYGAGLDGVTLRRWLLAYFCFYHAGVACRVAESADPFREMEKGIAEGWPRGTERRHFRGQEAANTLEFLRVSFRNPEGAIRSLEDARTFSGISSRVRTWRGFGPWVAFKVADVLERVLGQEVSFDDCELSIYREPAEAARILSPSETLEFTIGKLVSTFSDEAAPPSFDRPVNVQEVETILCKWKSHIHGRYPVGKDIEDIGAALEGVWSGKLSDHLSRSLPPRVVE